MRLLLTADPTCINKEENEMRRTMVYPTRIRTVEEYTYDLDPLYVCGTS